MNRLLTLLAVVVLPLLLTPAIAQNSSGSGPGNQAGAAKAGANYLPRTQMSDGSWEGNADAGFSDQAATGLSLLAFLGAGETHKHGKFKAQVRTGLGYLKNRQQADGWLAPTTGTNLIRDHAIATLALTEAYGLTLSPLFKEAAQKATNALFRCRQKKGAWGATSDPGPLDLTTTAWAVMAATSAKSSGLIVDPAAITEVLAVLLKEKVTNPNAPQSVAEYIADSRAAAILLFCHLLLGESHPEKSRWISRLESCLPVWDKATPGAIDQLYWYFGTLAMFHVGGKSWDLWNDALKPAVIDHQRKDRDMRGSWDPIGPFTGTAGRVASTALMTMCMEVYYRYAKVFGGAPVGGAGFRIDVPPSTGGTVEPNDNPYGDTFFKHYGVNPFVDTEDDRLSTFAMDVDTASYSVARRYLTDGHLPDPAGVRVEEFVNRFPSDDPAPDEGVFRLAAEAMPSPFGGVRYHLLRLTLRAKEVDPAERKPARLTFVVDVSGSMAAGNRLELVKKSLRLLVNQLRPEDQIALVIYGSTGQVLLGHTSEKRRILQAVKQLESGGSTNAEEGLTLGYREAGKAFSEGAINRVILCSDGVANVGKTGPDSILKAVKKNADRGIEISTIGFGMGNYNDILMEQLADRGNGNYAYVDRLQEAKRVFVENLTGMLQTVAKNAKVQVDFNPDVVSRYRLLGYENRDVADEDFRNNEVDGGEVGAGHTVTALYELKLHKGAPDGPLGRFRVRFGLPDQADHVVEEDISLPRDLLTGAPSRHLRLCAGVAEFAELLRESYWARDGSFGAVAAYLDGLSPEYADDPAFKDLLDLARKAAGLVKPNGAEPPEERPALHPR